MGMMGIFEKISNIVKPFLKKSLVIVAAISLVITPVLSVVSPPITDQSFVNKINSVQNDWLAVNHDMFTNKTLNDISHLFSTEMNKGINAEPYHYSGAQLPENFDSREKWGKCVHPIRDQGNCGSCWAFGATESLSDRFCINGVDVILSPQDLVSCDDSNYGCNGGNLDTAWLYMCKNGVMAEDCWNYKAEDLSCPTDNVCPSKKGEIINRYKCDVKTIKTPINEQSIKAEIFIYGPVEAAFYVYRDFINYASGVYHHVTGDLLGGHAIKMLGWGETNEGVKYWICANSWGSKWGDSGYFKILRGVDECSIESYVISASPLMQTNNDFCPLCKILSKKIMEMLKEEIPVEEIIKELEHICDLYPNDKCKKFLETYLPIIEKYIETPEVICEKIGVCMVAESVGKCDVCQYFFTIVEDFLGSETTEEKIVEAIEKVCKLLPFEETCDVLIETYLPEIIELIISKEPPSKICEQLKLCAKLSVKSENGSENGSEICPLCKLIVKEIEARLLKGETEEKILEEVEQICSVFPKLLQKKCINFVDENVHKIIEIIKNEGPNFVCGKLRFCKPSKRMMTPGPGKCIVCKEFFKILEDLLGNERTEKYIIEKLEKLCTKAKHREFCEKLTEKYVIIIIEKLIAHFPPHLICKKINFCSGLF